MSFSQWRVSSQDLTSRLRRLEGAYPKNNHTGPVFSKAKYTLPSSSAVLSTGQINPLSAVQAKGNLSPYVLSGNVGFTAGPNTVTAWWDGTNSSVPIAVRRADGTSFSVPKGSQTINGLTPSTQYGFSIFWNVNGAGGLSFGPGDTGSPRIALSPAAPQSFINAALQMQQSFDAEPVYAGLVYFTTTAAGGGASGAGNTSAGVPYSPIRVRGLDTF
jgi:hypothetical protein